MMRKTILAILIIFVIVQLLGALEEDHSLSFQLDGNQYRIEERNNGTERGSDVWIVSPFIRNLSEGISGIHVFPVVGIGEKSGCFVVTWILAQENTRTLCVYDSRKNRTQVLPLKGFKYAAPVRVIFYQGVPRFIVFQGNNSTNTDIFNYNLETGQIRNVTQTASSELRCEIEDKNGCYDIQAVTIGEKRVYRVDKRKGSVRMESVEAIPVPIGRPASSDQMEGMNTLIGFGDSITWGRMYMFGWETDYHPELAYLSLLKDAFSVNYGAVEIINLGIPGNGIDDAYARLDTELSAVKGQFFLVLLGTNDVARIHIFDADRLTEVLREIMTRARDIYGLYPIISTIPPRRLPESTGEDVPLNSQELNRHIIDMAVAGGFAYIDTYSAYKAYSTGWVSLLEDIKGIHPNPQGHQVIAGLFKAEILKLAPMMPQRIEEMSTETGTYRKTVRWMENQEFDFGHYEVEFGYSPRSLSRTVMTNSAYYRFLILPFQKGKSSSIYFRIRSVDKDGNSSAFSAVKELVY